MWFSVQFSLYLLIFWLKGHGQMCLNCARLLSAPHAPPYPLATRPCQFAFGTATLISESSRSMFYVQNQQSLLLFTKLSCWQYIFSFCTHHNSLALWCDLCTYMYWCNLWIYTRFKLVPNNFRVSLFPVNQYVHSIHISSFFYFCIPYISVYCIAKTKNCLTFIGLLIVVTPYKLGHTPRISLQPTRVV
jgi:hypothetical protein